MAQISFCSFNVALHCSLNSIRAPRAGLIPSWQHLTRTLAPVEPITRLSLRQIYPRQPIDVTIWRASRREDVTATTTHFTETTLQPQWRSQGNSS